MRAFFVVLLVSASAAAGVGADPTYEVLPLESSCTAASTHLAKPSVPIHPLRGAPLPPDLPGEPRVDIMAVRPVLVVPSDVLTDPSYTNLTTYRQVVCPMMTELQHWYGDHTLRSGGQAITFTFLQPVELRTEKTLAWFKGCSTSAGCQPNVQWQPTLEDLCPKGYCAATPNRNTVVWVVGGRDVGLGVYWGNHKDHEGGMALLADGQLMGYAGQCDRKDYWWCGSFPGRTPRTLMGGATAHEIGHGFSLPHTECVRISSSPCMFDAQRKDMSVMFAWWNYPEFGFHRTNGFIPEEVLTLAASPMFEPAAPFLPT